MGRVVIDKHGNPFDFYKFAEQTAEDIKEASNVSCDSYAPPPRWLNKRPKITYSAMCAMAIQVYHMRVNSPYVNF